MGGGSGREEKFMARGKNSTSHMTQLKNKEIIVASNPGFSPIKIFTVYPLSLLQ